MTTGRCCGWAAAPSRTTLTVVAMGPGSAFAALTCPGRQQRKCACTFQLQFSNSHSGAGAIAPAPPVFIPSGSSIVVMVVMMMMVVMMPMGQPDDDARPIRVMMMVVMVILRELDISIRGRRGSLFVDCLQECARVRDRLQELGIGVGP